MNAETNHQMPPENLKLTALPYDFSVCKLDDARLIDFSRAFTFAAKTDEEVSLVCLTDDVPEYTLARDDGWRAFRISGTLDFSLVGILSRITALLADADIGIFAISTYNTDYVLTRKTDFMRALVLLRMAGYEAN